MMKRKFPVLPLAAAAAFALSPALVAQTTSTTEGTKTTMERKTGDTKVMNTSDQKVAHADKAFAIKAAKDGMAEVELGRLAADKASSDEVKAFARRMVDDHTKANDELKTIAASKGITLPTETDRSHKSKMSKLQNLSGAEFDKAYVADMVKDHDKGVKLFQKEADKGKDADLKSFAQKTVTTLHDHHQSINQIAATVGVKHHGTLPAAGTTEPPKEPKQGKDYTGTNPNPSPNP